MFQQSVLMGILLVIDVAATLKNETLRVIALVELIQPNGL